jgi:nitronate monooxygenase
MNLHNEVTERLGIEIPLFCGAMYPCSNPELVAAVSEAGAMGIVQPLSLTYVYGHEMRAGLKYIRTLTKKPIGLNILVEKSSKIYEDRMKRITDIALEEGVRFFVTALGSPRWVVDKVHAVGGTVFHDVTERKWALRALEDEVDGFIAVNRLAGGHAGAKEPQALLEELRSLGKPVVAAGGVGKPEDFVAMLRMGYQAVQLGTRFIASRECRASDEYKQGIVRAKASDIVLTYRLTGVPVAVINTPLVQKVGTEAGPLMRWLLKHPKGKHYARLWYSIQSFRHLKRTMNKPMGYQDYWQAGKSVESIDGIESAGEIVRKFADRARQA